MLSSSAAFETTDHGRSGGSDGAGDDDDMAGDDGPRCERAREREREGEGVR